MSEPELTILNRYELTAPPQQFEAAIQSLVTRVHVEGHPGIMSYRFFVNAETALARAVIDYATADAWIGHHDIAMSWPEMRTVHEVARLAEVEFLGPLTPEIQNWLKYSNLSATVISGNTRAAGFRRG